MAQEFKRSGIFGDEGQGVRDVVLQRLGDKGILSCGLSLVPSAFWSTLQTPGGAKVPKIHCTLCAVFPGHPTQRVHVYLFGQKLIWGPHMGKESLEV